MKLSSALEPKKKWFEQLNIQISFQIYQVMICNDIQVMVLLLFFLQKFDVSFPYKLTQDQKTLPLYISCSTTSTRILPGFILQLRVSENFMELSTFTNIQCSILQREPKERNAENDRKWHRNNYTYNHRQNYETNLKFNTWNIVCRLNLSLQMREHMYTFLYFSLCRREKHSLVTKYFFQ